MMRSPASERSLIIQSDDDDDDARSGHDVEEPEPEQDSDSSSSSSSCTTPRRGPSSPPYIQQWPQSYRSRRFLVPSSLVIMLEEESLVALPASQLSVCSFSHPQFQFSDPLHHLVSPVILPQQLQFSWQVGADSPSTVPCTTLVEQTNIVSPPLTEYCTDDDS
jgi:hypothetical protein